MNIIMNIILYPLGEKSGQTITACKSYMMEYDFNITAYTR